MSLCFSKVQKNTGQWSLGTLGSGAWEHWAVEPGNTGQWSLGTLGSGAWEHSAVEPGNEATRLCYMQ